MKGLRNFLALNVLLAAMMGLVGCSDGNGSSETCEDKGLHECEDGQCHECCNTDQCQSGEECNEETFVCEVLCTEQGADCSSDRGSCCDGFACDLFKNTCEAVCSADDDCVSSHADVDFASDLQCQNDGTCDFQHCSSDDNCRPGTVCYNGDCVSPADCSQVASCSLVPDSVVTQTGTTAILSASAFLTSGALAPGASFTWASGDDTIASVAAGTVTGGASTGSTKITATVAGCDTTCTADVLNYGAVESGVRVVAIDELTGEPLEGITVDIEGVGTQTTDSSGVAAFAGADLSTTPANVTLSDSTIGYVSFMQADSNDIIAHLGIQPDDTKAGGYVGKFDFNKVICAPEDPCEVKLGFTGCSIPGNLFNLNVDSLIGEMIMTHIELGSTVVDQALPGGLVFGLNDTWFRESYQATGTPGMRVAWGLGGKLNLADLIEILGPVISGGDMDIGAILAAVLPMFSSFYTSIVPNVAINPIDKVADTNDINGNEDTDELVPDYDNFPQLPGGDMVLKVPMDQSVTISVPALPSDGNGGYLYDGVIVLAGVMVNGAGLVPLGISAGLDAPTAEDTPDGTIDDFTINVSDVAGRLPDGTYDRVIVVLALNIAKLSDKENTDPLVLGGQVRYVDSFSGKLNLNAFMEPASYTFDSENRQVTVDSVPSDASAMLFLANKKDVGLWQIFHPIATGTIEMPAAPTAGDRLDTVGMGVLKFSGGVTYSDLIEFNDTNLVDLVRLVSDFVVVYGNSGGGSSLSCATGASTGSVFSLAVMLLGLALIRRRK